MYTFITRTHTINFYKNLFLFIYSYQQIYLKKVSYLSLEEMRQTSKKLST
jgi:hypothetical protein